MNKFKKGFMTAVLRNPLNLKWEVNMNNFKKISILLLSMMLVFALAGCGGNQNAADSGSGDVNTEKEADTEKDTGAEKGAEAVKEAGAVNDVVTEERADTVKEDDTAKDADTVKEVGAEKDAAARGVDLKEMLRALYTSEEELGLAGKYTSTKDIPEAKVDPELVGVWKRADGSLTYVYNEDGTAVASMELYGDNESTFTCITSGGYHILAEDLEMVDYSDEEEKTVPVVSYYSYKIENDALYLTSVESPDEYSTQSITQILVFYRADENGDITASASKNPVDIRSFYGEWVYGDDEEGRFTIDENGFTLDGGKTLPVAWNEKGSLVIGDADGITEYSAGLAYERLYDNSDTKEVTGENYSLAISYTGKDEKDRPNLADAMNDWHAEYGYDQFYYSLNARTPLE